MKYKTNQTKATEKKSSKVLLKPLLVLQYKIHRKRYSVLVSFAQIWQHCLGCHVDPPVLGELLVALPGRPGRCALLPFGFQHSRELLGRV